MNSSMPSRIDATALRRDAVAAILGRKSGHIMSSLSVSDVIAAGLEWWYAQREQTGEASADLILSKGHAAPALYAGLAQLMPPVLFTADSLRHRDSAFQGHPSAGALPSILCTTGSLGIGVAFAVGRALARTTDGHGGRVVVIASDGELQEGLTWESIHIAARFQLAALTIVVDSNGWQTSGPVPGSLATATDWQMSTIETVHVDGHDTGALRQVFDNPAGGPRLVMAHTNRLTYLPSLDDPAELYGDRVPPETVKLISRDLGIGDAS